MFEIIPAIDLLNGKCVRLRQGRYDAETIYSLNPVEVALKWENEGASRLHVVDLDGARTGIPKNIDILKAISKEVKIPVQIGGGIRNLTLIQELLDFGIDRVVLGTTAVKNPNVLSQFCEKFDDKIAVAIDAKDGKAATEGWVKISKKDILTLAKEAVAFGVKRFIYTEISRDGMLTGPNFEGIKNFASEIEVPIIASGGISSKEDIDKLRAIGVEGCIIGKALYEGKFRLEDVL